MVTANHFDTLAKISGAIVNANKIEALGLDHCCETW